MANENETISVAEFASVLGLDPKSSKADVLARLAPLGSAQPDGTRKRWKLSKAFKNRAEFDELSRQPVRVRVSARQPICERGEVYYPAELDKNGTVKKPSDVFITDKARLRKIAWCVEEVPSNTPTTAELRAKEKADKN